jgi:putative ABC transport system permease protein
VRLSEAQSQIGGIAARLAHAYPETNRGTLAAPGDPRPMLALPHTRLSPEFRGMVATIGAIMMTAVALVLVIACANIASLLLSRATSRDREMAVRLALGATPARLVRQMLTESVVLGLGAGALGLLLSLWTADLLPSFFPPDQARMLDTSLDGMTVAFVLSAALAGSILFGLAPALQAAAPSALSSLRTGVSRISATGSRKRLRQLLVAAQIAVSAVLLVAAALLVQSRRNAVHADLGFGTRDGVLASVELPAAEFGAPQGLAYYRVVLARVRSIPGVESAAFARTLPLARPARRGFRIDGYVPRPGEDTELSVNVVTDDYFETMRIQVLAGRTFDSRDRDGGSPAAIVNDLLARRYFGGSAVGRRLTDSSGRVLTIVGVVRTGTNLAVQEPPVPFVYYPLEQEYASRMTLVARTANEPLSMIDPIRRQVISADRRVPVFRTIPLASHFAEATAGDRLTAALVTVCGAIALLLAAIGLYGVVAYAVATRRHEIGVRLALGARPRHITRLVLGEGLGVTAIGIAVGLGLGAAAARALESFLFGVSASDPATYAAVPAFLTVVAALAAWMPARRALRVQPTAVLRQE